LSSFCGRSLDDRIYTFLHPPTGTSTQMNFRCEEVKD
jgi:hypothetical protein